MLKVKSSFFFWKLDHLIVFIGIYYAVGGIGIGLGFLATSQFLKVYTYIKKPFWLTPNYSEWVGAWWLVYALGTCLSLILCLFLCLVDVGRRRKDLLIQKNPQTTPNPTYQLLTPSTQNSLTTDLTPTGLQQEIILNEKESLSIETSEEKCTTLTNILEFKEFIFDIFSLMKHLLLNLRFMGITGCAIIEALLIKGYLAFLSKHIEYQFRTTASHSSVYIGVISLFSVKKQHVFL